MPVLRNNRRELFAQLLFQGFSAVDAYEEAGFKRHSGNACTLSQHPEILDRLEEIRAVPVGTRAIAARNKVTPESLIGMHEAIYQKVVNSESGGQMSAGVAAVREISVLTGHRVERSEIGAPGDFDHLNDDELERLLIERLGALGLSVVPGSDTQH